MSEPRTSAPSPVELEPVTCWPLIIGSVGFVCLGLFTVVGAAAWSAFFPPAKPSAIVAAAPEKEKPVRVEPSTLPEQPAKPVANERVVKVRREVIDRYVPMPRPRQVVVEQKAPPARTVSQIPVKAPRIPVIPTYQKPPPRTEAELLEELWKDAIDISLETEKGASKSMFEAGKKQWELRQEAEKKRKSGKEVDEPLPSFSKTIKDLLKSRSDLRGLPLRDEKDCQSSKEFATILGEVSLEVRTLQARVPRVRAALARSKSNEESIAKADGPLSNYLAELKYLADYQSNDPGAQKEINKIRKGKRTRMEPEIVRPLEQMFQTESEKVRGGLIATLGSIKTKESTQALARRAVFDLSDKVRSAAIDELQTRSLDDARPILRAALRHPWAPAAEHAAVALAELNDQEATPLLEKVLDEPDPREPYKDGEKWMKREVVRVNHLSNCLLCHPPSIDRKDVVSGPIPIPGEPLPVVYYGRSRLKGNAVRADVVYFRQDFSAMHKVDKPNKWPDMQRFDYLVRTRELTSKEVVALTAKTRSKQVARKKDRRQMLQYALYALAVGKSESPAKSD